MVGKARSICEREGLLKNYIQLHNFISQSIYGLACKQENDQMLCQSLDAMLKQGNKKVYTPLMWLCTLAMFVDECCNESYCAHTKEYAC